MCVWEAARHCRFLHGIRIFAIFGRVGVRRPLSEGVSPGRNPGLRVNVQWTMVVDRVGPCRQSP